VQLPDAPVAFKTFPVTVQPDEGLYVIKPVPEYPDVVNVAVSLYLRLVFEDTRSRFCWIKRTCDRVMVPGPAFVRVYPMVSVIELETDCGLNRKVVFATLLSGYEGEVMLELFVEMAGVCINRKLEMSAFVVSRCGLD
jgi:hypothetical protein